MKFTARVIGRLARRSKRRVKRNDIWSVETRRTERETRLNDWDPLQRGEVKITRYQ